MWYDIDTMIGWLDKPFSYFICMAVVVSGNSTWLVSVAFETKTSKPRDLLNFLKALTVAPKQITTLDYTLVIVPL